MNHFFRTNTLRRGGCAVFVIIDQLRAVCPAARRDVLRRQGPNFRRDAEERVEVQIPVRAAVHFQIERREFPEIKGVVNRVHLLQQREQRVIEDLLQLRRLGNARRQGGTSETLLDRGRQRASQAARLRLSRVGG